MQQTTPKPMVGFFRKKERQIDVMASDGVMVRLSRVVGGDVRYEILVGEDAARQHRSATMSERIGRLRGAPRVKKM